MTQFQNMYIYKCISCRNILLEAAKIFFYLGWEKHTEYCVVEAQNVQARGIGRAAAIETHASIARSRSLNLLIHTSRRAKHQK